MTQWIILKVLKYGVRNLGALMPQRLGSVRWKAGGEPARLFKPLLQLKECSPVLYFGVMNNILFLRKG